jgi:GNAT superfamily N-acetyltransferase
LRPLDALTAEIKRMFVLPGNRGSGVARAVLRGLEAEARARGFKELKLETGTAQPDAVRCDEREGYGLIENFGAYTGEPLSVCYARPAP